jgi:hypothetical protein
MSVTLTGEANIVLSPVIRSAFPAVSIFALRTACVHLRCYKEPPHVVECLSKNTVDQFRF